MNQNTEKLAEDPRVTAYALGELEGEERAALEAELRGDAAARAAVEEIRALGGRLGAALGQEGEPGTTARGQAQARARVLRFPQLYFVIGGLAAAGVALVITLRGPVPERARSKAAAEEKRYVTVNLPELPDRSGGKEGEKGTAGTGMKLELTKDLSLLAVAEDKLTAKLEFTPDGPVEVRARVITAEAVLANVQAELGKRMAEADAQQAKRVGKVYRYPSDDKFVITAQPAGSVGLGAGARARREARPARSPGVQGTDQFAAMGESGFLSAGKNPRSTFAVDVDTASYAVVRKFLQDGKRPPREAVRIEELLNYFPWSDAPPAVESEGPLAATMEVSEAPWAEGHRLVRIGLKGREVATEDRAAANLVERLADKGNGSYDSIASRREAEKLRVEQVSGTLVTIAKDVKIQVEFNPAQVASYRLIGYENRRLRKEDFNHDQVDAGEMGAGHTVTALYEIVPAGAEGAQELAGAVDGLKYRKPETGNQLGKAQSEELLTLQVRWKKPDGEVSARREWALTDGGARWAAASADFKFAAAVAGFGMLLRESPHKGATTWAGVRAWAEAGMAGADVGGYRTEFLALVRRAEEAEE